jgi:hypothetical protein
MIMQVRISIKMDWIIYEVQDFSCHFKIVSYIDLF